MVKASEFKIESLSLPLNMLHKISSLFKNELDKIKSKNDFRVLNLSLCDGSQADLGI